MTADRIVSTLLEDDSLDSMEGAPRQSREQFVSVQQREQLLLQRLRLKFVEKVCHGYTDRNGSVHPPVSPEQAELLWKALEPKFIDLVKNDETIRSNHAIDA